MVRAMAIHDEGSGPALFVGGYFDPPAPGGGIVARWDGAAWSGDDRRARPVVAVEVLRQLGILSADDLADVSPMPIKNRRGDAVGHVEAVVSI